METLQTPDGGQVRILQMCAVDFTARQFLQPLIRSLEQAGCNVAVSCAGGVYFDEMRAAGFQMIENPIQRNANVVAHIKSFFATVRLLKEFQPHVLHVHTPIAALLGRLAGRWAGVPVIIYTAHGFYFHEHTSPLRKQALVLLEKIGAWCGDFIFTVSEEDAHAAVETGIAQRNEVKAILNGVDAAHFDPKQFSQDEVIATKAQYGIPADALVIGFMGRMVREKGVFELVHAIAEIARDNSSVYLLMVGDVLPSDYDGGKAELKNLIESLGLQDRVKFAGLVSDPAPALAAMDIFVLPSYREGMPISLLEAMSMGRPCVATDIRGCREEVVAGVTGLLVPRREVTGLAAAMKTFCDDPAQRDAMGNAGRARVLERFQIHQTVERQLTVYKELLKGINSSQTPSI